MQKSITPETLKKLRKLPKLKSKLDGAIALGVVICLSLFPSLSGIIGFHVTSKLTTDLLPRLIYGCFIGAYLSSVCGYTSYQFISLAKFYLEKRFPLAEKKIGQFERIKEKQASREVLRKTEKGRRYCAAQRGVFIKHLINQGVIPHNFTVRDSLEDQYYRIALVNYGAYKLCRTDSDPNYSLFSIKAAPVRFALDDLLADKSDYLDASSMPEAVNLLRDPGKFFIDSLLLYANENHGEPETMAALKSASRRWGENELLMHYKFKIEDAFGWSSDPRYCSIPESAFSGLYEDYHTAWLLNHAIARRAREF
jgi:hypothetical protein